MDQFSEQQLFFMRRAIAVGEQGRFRSAPNPWVGCVIVKQGRIIGEGAHVLCGSEHAEIVALRQAGEQARGADMYVTLEPCCHQGKTPPCVPAILAAHIRQVFVGVRDPDSRVSGQGIAWLRREGVLVHEWVGYEEASTALEEYLYHRKHGQPFTVLKAAVTIDGQTASAQGRSQWITCPEARRDVGRERSFAQGVVVGTRTLLIDNPSLTARNELGQLYADQPDRIILDTRGILPSTLRLFADSLKNVIYVTTSQCPEAVLRHRESVAKQVLIVNQDANGRIDLLDLWSRLGAMGYLRLFVEGGATLHTELIRHRLAQRMMLYIGSKILGSGHHAMLGKVCDDLTDAVVCSLRSCERVGESVKIIYDV